MNKLKIKPIQIPRVFGKRRSCLYDILATIATYNKIEYKYCFIDELRFEFNYQLYEKECFLGNAIKITENKVFSNFEKYSGYKLIHCYFDKFQDELNYIINSLAINQPAIVHFDAFYLPWDPFFGKMHNDHCVLITGLDLLYGKVNILDPYFNTNNEIDLKSIENASSFFIYFEKSGNVKTIPCLTDFICEGYADYFSYQPNIYKNIVFFSKQLRYSFDMEREFKNNSIFDQNDLFVNLSEIVLRLGLFFDSIEYFYNIQKNQNLLNINKERKCKHIVCDWVAWKDVGMAVDYHTNQDTTFKAIKNDEAISIVDKSLSSSLCRVFGGKINYESDMIQILPNFDISLSNNVYSKILQSINLLKNETQKNLEELKAKIDNIYIELLNLNSSCNLDLVNIISKCWAHSLGIKKLDIKNDFLNCGGDSIAALTVVNDISNYLNIELSLNDFMSNSTVESLSHFIAKKYNI